MLVAARQAHFNCSCSAASSPFFSRNQGQPARLPAVWSTLLAGLARALCNTTCTWDGEGSHPFLPWRGGAPCPLAPTRPSTCPQNRLVNLTVGSGSAAVNYQFAVDTGSSLLEISCQSAAAQANCGGKALSSSYQLTSAQAVNSASACAGTGINCFVPEVAGQPGVCYFSQGVSLAACPHGVYLGGLIWGKGQVF